MSELFNVDGVGVMDNGATVGGNMDEMGKKEELVWLVVAVAVVVVIVVGELFVTVSVSL